MENKLYSVPVAKGRKVEWELKTVTEMTAQELLYKFQKITIDLFTDYDGDPNVLRESLKRLEDEIIRRCK